MNTDVSKDKIETLKKLLEGQKHARDYFERQGEGWEVSVANITPSVEALEWAIARIDELEGAAEVVPKPELALGDLVEIIRPESAFQGRQGTIVNIEPLAQRYPYSVEIAPARMGSTNYGSSIAYYNIADLKKVN